MSRVLKSCKRWITQKPGPKQSCTHCAPRYCCYKFGHWSVLKFTLLQAPLTIFIPLQENLQKNQTLLFFWIRRSLTRARCSSLSSSIDLISRKIIALTISILSRGLTRHNSHHCNVLICLVCQYSRECTKKNNSKSDILWPNPYFVPLQYQVIYLLPLTLGLPTVHTQTD